MISEQTTLPSHFMGDTGGQARWQSQQEDRMLQRAIKQRWPIPEKYKQAVIDRQVRIAISEESNAREATAAARVLVAAEAQNQADDRAEPIGGQHVHFHQHGGEMPQDVVASAGLIAQRMAELKRSRENGAS